HLDVPPSVAAKDALKRWRESEEVRFVDPNYILNDIGETPKQSFSVLSNGHSKLYATETWKRSGSGFRVEARVRLAGVSRGNGQGNRASRVTDAKEVRSPDEESTARLSGGASKRQRPVLRQPSNRNLVTASGKRIRTVKDLLEVSPDDPRLDPDNIAFDPALSSAIGRYLGQGSRKVRAELRKARERAEKAYLARDLAKDSYADVAEEFEGFKGGKRPEAGAEIYIPWKRHSLKIGSGWRPPNLPSMVERAYFADTFSPHVRAMLDEFASSHYREPEVVLMRKVDSDSARISKRHVPSSVSASLSGPPPGGKRPSELALQDQGGKAQRYPESLIRDFMAYYGFDNPPSLLDYLASELGIDKRDLNEKVVLTPREASRAEAAKKLAAQTLKEQEKARNYNKLQALDEAMSSGEVSKAEYAKSRVSLLASGLEIKGVKSSAAKRVIDNALKDAAITKREHGLLMEAKSASAQKKRLTRGAITVPKKAPPPSGYVRGMSLWQFKRTLKTAEDKAKATVLWEKARRDHYSQKPAVTLAGDHLRTAPNLGKLDLRGLRRRSEEAIFTTYEAAKYARHLLEEEMGENLKGSRLDAELALSEQTRNSGRVQLFVERGFHNEKGEKLTLGLPEIKQLIPGDVEQWQEYRRALRENELSQRGERPITPERVAANQHVVDSYLESIDKEALAAADREFDKFAYHQLKLYEEYGLRAEGWADEIRLENQAYFPMVRASLLDDLSDLNPLTVASPESTVKRAHGGEHYADGLAAMAERTERIIRAGELNKAMLPFVDEAAKHENLSWMATEITQDVNLHRSLESNAKLRDKLDLAITKSALHLERLRQRLLQPELDLDPFKKQTLEEDYHNALVTLEDLEARLSAVSDPDGQQLPDPFPGGLPVEGVEPIFTVRDKGVERVFRLDKDLWNAVRGLQPQVRPLWFRFFEGFARVARAGTTKYNPLFRLLFNVLIDVPSAVIVHGLNPLRLGKGFVTAAKGWNSGEYIQAVMNKVVTDAKGASDFVDQQWLYEPTTRSRVQQKADKLMEIQGIRVMADGAKAGLRAFERASQVIEETTRLAMYQQKAAKYMKDGMPELEAKRRAAADSASLIDFGEAGEFLRWVGRVTPYAAVKPQVIMSIARGIRREPLKFTMRAIGLITVPKMIEYMMYKDDAEYKKLPRYVKDGSFVFKKPGGGWLALRAPGELMVLFGGIPRRIMESEGDAGKAAAEIAGSLAKEYTTAAIPTFAAALGQQVTYLNSGGVFDARFWSFKRPPTPDGEPGHRYEQFVQQTDTLLGSLGRLGARNVGYFLGEEKEPPNPLQRFAPEPEKGSSKRRKTPSYKGKRKNPFAPSGPPKPSFKPGF
ncbi:MAG TPA: hypothetical protein PKA27_06910, partial [Fimbriimonadaceae bacterium]|nr:hypothetical protein [Fimbriimonadaceae bacterium]